jgi:hypothetical protein
MKARQWFLVSSLCLASTRCYAPPARSSGPSAGDGVELAIVGQYCEQSVDPDWGDNQVVQIRMRIGVTNTGREGVEFHPENLRMVAPDGVSPAPVAADDWLVVAPGETKVFALRFMNRGSLKCKEWMQLDPTRGLRAGARAIQLPPISFLAREGG